MGHICQACNALRRLSTAMFKGNIITLRKGMQQLARDLGGAVRYGTTPMRGSTVADCVCGVGVCHADEQFTKTWTCICPAMSFSIDKDSRTVHPATLVRHKLMLVRKLYAYSTHWPTLARSLVWLAPYKCASNGLLMDELAEAGPRASLLQERSVSCWCCMRYHARSG